MGVNERMAILCAAAYLLGSVPFGVLIARLKGVDLTKVGSGNTGATNVVRALGRTWGVVVFALDMLKGLLPVLAARWFLPDPVGPLDPQAAWFLVGLFAVLGHAKSPFLGFRGGKGISTSMGIGLGAAPVVALLCFAAFLVVLLTVRYMPVASIVGVTLSVILGAVLPGQSLQLLPMYALLTIAVVYLHRANLQRLRAGTEPKFQFRKQEKTSA
jgi:glycerol-3-phosphate acyltransferase PlsY